mmetsp:Transcript_4853/g.14385  ORF Transcript_4853/g.14385 Transcript_4853/m.14385 type:complete len:245 (+) Transcript_4853:152-886(+)
MTKYDSPGLAKISPRGTVRSCARWARAATWSARRPRKSRVPRSSTRRASSGSGAGGSPRGKVGEVERPSGGWLESLLESKKEGSCSREAFLEEAVEEPCGLSRLSAAATLAAAALRVAAARMGSAIQWHQSASVVPTGSAVSSSHARSHGGGMPDGRRASAKWASAPLSFLARGDWSRRGSTMAARRRASVFSSTSRAALALLASSDRSSFHAARVLPSVRPAPPCCSSSVHSIDSLTSRSRCR